MRTWILTLISILVAIGLTGCGRRQSDSLDSLQDQLQFKDKTIAELNQKIAELEQRNNELQTQIVKAADADALADAVGRRLDARMADIRSRLDLVLQATGATNGVVFHPGLNKPADDASTQKSQNSATPPADANRRKLKFDF